MNFIVIGEQVDKLTDVVKANNEQINWQKIYSLRNILAHHYFGINVEIVWQIISVELPKLKEDLNKLVNQWYRVPNPRNPFKSVQSNSCNSYNL